MWFLLWWFARVRLFLTTTRPDGGITAAVFGICLLQPRNKFVADLSSAPSRHVYLRLPSFPSSSERDLSEKALATICPASKRTLVCASVQIAQEPSSPTHSHNHPPADGASTTTTINCLRDCNHQQAHIPPVSSRRQQPYASPPPAQHCRRIQSTSHSAAAESPGAPSASTWPGWLHLAAPRIAALEVT